MSFNKSNQIKNTHLSRPANEPPPSAMEKVGTCQVRSDIHWTNRPNVQLSSSDAMTEGGRQSSRKSLND